jgi:putative redox protein
MADDAQRSVEVERIGLHQFRATNVRGGTLDFGEGTDTGFSPIELFLTAIAGCTALDVEYITGKRAEPISFSVGTSAQKVRDDNGNHLTDIVMRFAVAFPDGDGGDAAREVLPSALQRSHDRLCTVSRTVELSASVTVHIDGAEELS